MAEEIVIEKNTFFNRLSSFYTAWKADRRSGNAVFGGVGSIIILMGKTDEANSFQKNNAIHVCLTSAFPFSIPSGFISILGILTINSFGFLDMSSQQLF